MDGVIADFDKRMKQIAPGRTTVDESLETDRIIAAHETFFEDLPIIEGCQRAIGVLSFYYEIYFLSTPMYAVPHSYSGKRRWIRRYFGEWADKRLILTHRKDLAIGHYLIDDRTKNGAGEFKGKLIRYGSLDFPSWSIITSYLVKQATKGFWRWVPGRQQDCQYKKFCLWSFKIFNFGFDGYILRYEAATTLPWHTDQIKGKHWRLNIKVFGKAYFLVKGISRKLWHDRFIFFRPDLHAHSLSVIKPTVKLSFGFAKFD